jgi:hypothetical protein
MLLGAVVILLDLIQLFAGNEFVGESIIIIVVEQLEILVVLNIELGLALELGQSLGLRVGNGDIHLLVAHGCQLDCFPYDTPLALVQAHARFVYFTFNHFRICEVAILLKLINLVS